MTFKTQAPIDPNQHKGLIILNSVTAKSLVVTGLSLTNSQPMHVAIVDSSGSQITIPAQATTPTVTSVSDSITSSTLIAASSSRKEVEFFNGSTAILYLLKGAGTASTSNYTVQVQSGGYYTTSITSAFTGIWASAPGGKVFITESV